MWNDAVFQVGILFAMAGGVLGAVWAGFHDHDSVKRFLAESVIAAIAAAGLAENYLPLNQVWGCAVVGVVVGLLTGNGLEVIRAIAPDALDGFFRGLVRRFLGGKEK